MRHCFAEINLANLKKNYRILRDLVPGNQFFCPMIKADAYGHGAERIAKTLIDEGVRHLGVALVEEAMELKECVGSRATLVVFGTTDETGAKEISTHGFSPVISTFPQLEAIAQGLDINKKYFVHVKINTGINRLGFDLHDLSGLKDELTRYPQIQVVGVCTHLSHGADVGASGFSSKQLTLFQNLAEKYFPGVSTHALNSAAILGLKTHDLPLRFGARPGLALYGAFPEFQARNPAAEQRRREYKFFPVMALKTEAVHFHKIKQGEIVSYGGVWTAQRPSTIAVAAIGYGDGYPRNLTNRGQMLFRGRRVPVVGTVCMDYTMLDVTDVVGAENGQIGEEVVVFGEQGGEELTAQEVADAAGTIPYEVFTRVSPRVPRVYLS